MLLNIKEIPGIANQPSNKHMLVTVPAPICAAMQNECMKKLFNLSKLWAFGFFNDPLVRIFTMSASSDLPCYRGKCDSTGVRESEVHLL